MDLKDELKETISESRQAKATQESWVLNAINNANKHKIKTYFCFIPCVFLAFAIAGRYVSQFASVSDWFCMMLSLVNLDAYMLYICIGCLIIGIFRIIYHLHQIKSWTRTANEIASMGLSKFRRTYM